MITKSDLPRLMHKQLFALAKKEKRRFGMNELERLMYFQFFALERKEHRWFRQYSREYMERYYRTPIGHAIMIKARRKYRLKHRVAETMYKQLRDLALKDKRWSKR